MEDEPQIPIYVEHDGTLKISGTTQVRGAGVCALHFLERRTENIDFFCIGANANQQAMKAMGIFHYLVEKDSQQSCSVAFQPLRFHTITTDPENGQKKEKDCVVWRTVLIEKPRKKDTANDTEKSASRRR